MIMSDRLDKQIIELPKEVRWCKKCVISNQRPRITFDSHGVCAACNNRFLRKEIDWMSRADEFEELLKKHRKSGKDWDVIVPSSGGKDSAYVAHKLKYEYGMNPLLVTWSPLQYTEIGQQNFESLCDSGFTTIRCTPDGQVHRLLARLCLEELGDAFHVFVLGQVYYPIHMALKFGINLIFYGENGEVEYAGDPMFIDKPYRDLLNDESWLKGYMKGTTIDELIAYGVETKDYLKEVDVSKWDLTFYRPPDPNLMRKKDISKLYFFSYFQEWIPQNNFYYAAENTGFLPNPERTEGTYSKYSSIDDKMDGFHYYLRYIKFGLGRCMEDAAHEIRDGHITRDEGIALMNKYEGEFPKKYFKDFLSYLDISEDMFWEIVDSWRLEHIWKKDGNKWLLRHPIE
jgi:N-acetyl sugar amidotransferase